MICFCSDQEFLCNFFPYLSPGRSCAEGAQYNNGKIRKSPWQGLQPRHCESIQRCWIWYPLDQSDHSPASLSAGVIWTRRLLGEWGSRAWCSFVEGPAVWNVSQFGASSCQEPGASIELGKEESTDPESQGTQTDSCLLKFFLAISWLAWIYWSRIV